MRWSPRTGWQLGVLFLAAVVIALTLERMSRPPPGEYIDDEEAVLARVIRSEIGNGSRKQKIYVAWVARNIARAKKKSLSEVSCSPCGPQMRGRPLSTAQKATDSDLQISQLVLRASQKKDPTGGATHFINPQLQDRLARSGAKSGYKGNNYRKVSRRWRRKYGLERYFRLGNTLEIWGVKRTKKKKDAGKRRAKKGKKK